MRQSALVSPRQVTFGPHCSLAPNGLGRVNHTKASRRRADARGHGDRLGPVPHIRRSLLPTEHRCMAAGAPERGRNFRCQSLPWLDVNRLGHSHRLGAFRQSPRDRNHIGPSAYAGTFSGGPGAHSLPILRRADFARCKAVPPLPKRARFRVELTDGPMTGASIEPTRPSSSRPSPFLQASNETG